MPGNSGGVWSWAMDGNNYQQVLGGTHHGLQVGALLWSPVHGIQGSRTGLTDVTHHIQYGGIHGHPPLGDGGVRVVCGGREFW